jgi:hypothetical protein
VPSIGKGGDGMPNTLREQDNIPLGKQLINRTLKGHTPKVLGCLQHIAVAVCWWEASR